MRKSKRSEHPTEEELGETLKESRALRKRRGAQDRSKFKKTDRDKRKKIEAAQFQKLEEKGLLRGRVLAVSGLEITVTCENKERICSLKGALKKEKNRLKNLVVVGDFVLFEALSEEEGVIIAVEPRRSFLARAEAITQRRKQLIAANIDQVLITVSVVDPLLRPPIIDRYIIAAHQGKMEAVVLINKADLLREKDVDPLLQTAQQALFHESMEAYARAEIPILAISAKTGEGMEQLKRLMREKASVFSGQSGVGKSSLINAMTGLNLEVGDTVKRTRKGGHTTTTAKLIPLAFGGFCIDTPGIRSFGVWKLKREEIEIYFSEIQAEGKACHFPNCHHLHETRCAVKEAVERGDISPLRYQSYCALIEETKTKHLRR